MKKQNFFKTQYKKSYNFLKSSSDFVIISLGIFCAFIILGFAFPIFFQKQIFEFLNQMVLEFEGLGIFKTILKIFLNNSLASILSIVFGVFLGIYPILSAVINGYLVGFVSRFSVEQEGLFILWRFLPHGIFEIPAIIFSFAIGLKIGIELLKSKKNFKNNLLEAGRIFIFVILPLIILAAIVEGILVFYIN